MGHSKLHHYVPQFYLRNFATDENRKLISLYNLKNNLLIENVPLRKQAREKNLYGEDDILEKALGELETYSSKVLNRLLQVLVPPPTESVYFKLLKKYILYQSMRTVKAGIETQQRIQVSTGELFKVMSKTNPKFKDVVARFENPVFVSLDMAEKGLPLMEYLDCKLLINQTNLPFITSDNPVAKYNQYCEYKGVEGGIGWAVKGFQIFFPLSPVVMLVLFDRFVYNYGTKKNFSLILSNEGDIQQLNSLQYFSSNSQLFFSINISKKYVEDLANRYSNLKQACGETAALKETILPSGETSIKLLNSSKDPKIKLDLSFSTLTKSAKKFVFSNGYSCSRHESLNKHRRTKQVKWDD